jgi:hypothetical protein
MGWLDKSHAIEAGLCIEYDALVEYKCENGQVVEIIDYTPQVYGPELPAGWRRARN